MRLVGGSYSEKRLLFGLLGLDFRVLTFQQPSHDGHMTAIWFLLWGVGVNPRSIV